jgi:hydroxypyruvate isomerase
LDGVGKAIEYAKALGVRQLNCLAGIVPQGVAPDAARATFVANLAFAAAKLKAEGCRLLIEPINTFDIPGFFLSRTHQALDIIAATGSDNIFVNDIYHMQRAWRASSRTRSAHLARIGHLQLADNPGRNEPGNRRNQLRVPVPPHRRAGLRGWIGCEYKPATTTAAGLSWLAPYR